MNKFAPLTSTLKAIQNFEKNLRVDGHRPAQSEEYGNLTTDPSNVGSAFAASALIKLPILSDRQDFPEICAKFRLAIRQDSDDASLFEISNADRCGKSEVELCNTFIEGAAQFIRWEMMLEQGKNIDNLVPN